MELESILQNLRHFLDNEKRLKAYPTKHKQKQIALFYLASKFEQGRVYTEKEVNEILIQWHTFQDWAMLRRELHDKSFFDRASNGSNYWLEENQPSMENII